WRQRLGGRQDVTFRLFLFLNHTFTRGEDPVLTSGFRWRRAMAPEVIETIAGWIWAQVGGEPVGPEPGGGSGDPGGALGEPAGEGLPPGSGEEGAVQPETETPAGGGGPGFDPGLMPGAGAHPLRQPPGTAGGLAGPEGDGLRHGPRLPGAPLRPPLGAPPAPGAGGGGGPGGGGGGRV